MTRPEPRKWTKAGPRPLPPLPGYSTRNTWDSICDGTNHSGDICGDTNRSASHGANHSVCSDADSNSGPARTFAELAPWQRQSVALGCLRLTLRGSVGIGYARTDRERSFNYFDGAGNERAMQAICRASQEVCHG